MTQPCRNFRVSRTRVTILTTVHIYQPRGAMRVHSRYLVWTLACFLGILSFCSTPAKAQYTDAQAMTDLGGPKEFERRRQALAKDLKDGWLLLFARQIEPEADHYREDNDFYYLTGIADPGAVLLMNAKNSQTFLFEPQQSSRKKRVYGPNVLSISPEEQRNLGFAMVLPLSDLDSFLAYFSGEGGPLWLRMGFPDKADRARSETGGDHADEYSAPYHPGLPFDRNL